MKNYLPKSTKSLPTQRIINEALNILECVGIPISTKSERGLEKMAVCFLAVAGVINDWKTATTQNYLKTRDIIKFVNLNFEENISSGSYDDIRRKDLKLLIIADFVINSGDDQSSATNNPTRGYSIHPDFERLLIHYATENWEKELLIFNQNRSILSDILFEIGRAHV